MVLCIPTYWHKCITLYQEKQKFQLICAAWVNYLHMWQLLACFTSVFLLGHVNFDKDAGRIAKPYPKWNHGLQNGHSISGTLRCLSMNSNDTGKTYCMHGVVFSIVLFRRCHYSGIASFKTTYISLEQKKLIR